MSKKLDEVLQLIPLIRGGERTWQDLANATGEQMGTDSMRRKYSIVGELQDEGYISSPANSTYKTVIETKEDGMTISDTLLQIALEDAKDSEYLLRAHGFDPTLWKIKESRQSFWGDGKIASRIAVKPIEGITEKILVDVFNNLSNSNPILPKNLVNNDSGLLLEINLADTHIGRLGWGKEVGENYDENIAASRFSYAIDDILSQVSHLNIEKILFIWSNDFFQTDGISNATQKGTPQDVSIRWQKMFDVGTNLLCESIKKMALVAPVETKFISANHDSSLSYYATKLLHAYFRKEPRVIVDISPMPRKYIQWGKVLLGFSHGEEGKQLNSLMAREQPKLFGSTVFRFFHCAHFHSQKSFEGDGCVVSHLGSLVSPDSWTYSKGYVGSFKVGYGFVYDREKGQRLQITSYVE